MKKTLILIICLLFLFSAIAIAETNVAQNQGSSGNAESGTESDATIVAISAEGTTESTETTEDSLETEIGEFEESETGDEEIGEIEQEIETDEEIEEELEITEEESEEIEEATQKIGLRAYALNRQLRYRINVRIVEAEAIIEYLEEKGIDASELQSILDEFKSVLESIDPASMTPEKHKEIVAELKTLTQSFKEKAKELIPQEDIPLVRQRMNQHRQNARERLQEEIKKEWKARELYNRKKLRDSIENVVKDAKQLRQDGKKLMEAAQRLKALHQLRDRYKQGNINASQIRNQWQNETRNYGLDRAAAVVNNERAVLAINIVRVRNAIREAKAQGQDITELENQLQTLNNELKDFVPGKVNSQQALAKAAEIKAKLQSLQNNPRVAQKLQTEQAIREAARQRLATQQQAITARQQQLIAAAKARAIATQNTATGTAANTDSTTGTSETDLTTSTGDTQ